MVQNIQSTKTATSMTELAKSQQAMIAESRKTKQAEQKVHKDEETKSLQTLTAKTAKSNDAILSELKRDAQSASLTAYQVSQKYGISLIKAQELLDKIHADKNGIIKENRLPENSTVSYRV